jgi:hypothetical protein
MVAAVSAIGFLRGSAPEQRLCHEKLLHRKDDNQWPVKFSGISGKETARLARR